MSESDDGSSADEGAADEGDGWAGVGRSMQVGIGCTVRDYCDGKSLASPWRWPVAARRYTGKEAWQEALQEVVCLNLALGCVEAMPFAAQEVASLKSRNVGTLRERGLSLQRLDGDRDELPLDFRFINNLLRSADDRERHLGTSAQGVKLGPGTRMGATACAVQAEETLEAHRTKGPLELSSGRAADRTMRRGWPVGHQVDQTAGHQACGSRCN